MADRSRVFNPPQDRIPDSDPSIVRVPLDRMDFAARSSQLHSWDKGPAKTIKNIPNGQ